MKRLLFALCLAAACCLMPLHADEPAGAIEIEPAIDFPVEPTFALTPIDDPIQLACSKSTKCSGGVTVSCSGTTSCTKVKGRCVSCTSGSSTTTYFCPGIDDDECSASYVAVQTSNVD